VDAFAWAVVGSVAGVVAAAAAILFGAIPLVRGHHKAPLMPAQGAPRAQVSDIKGVQVGNYNKQFNQFIDTYIERPHLSSVSAQGSVIVGDVPQRAPAFQPRVELVSRLGGSGPGSTVVRAVTGMRGVGKTQLAAAYARSRIDSDWRLVAWVNAADQVQMLAGLAEIAAALGVGEPDTSLENIGTLVRHWLEADGDRCLVVFDNATDVDGLARFVPAAGQCQVIITSNQRASGSLGQVVPVGVFTGQEALAFLAERTNRSDESGARELAEELGFLPLALAQAAAMISAQQLGYPVYLARLRTVPARDSLKHATGEPYPQGTAEAIVLALDAAADDDPTGLCQGLVNVVALLSAAGVSRPLLYAAGQQGLLQYPGVHRRRHAYPRLGAAAEPERIDDALGRLASASLLTFSTDDAGVTAHRLTMRVAVERQAQDGTLVGLGAGIAALLEAVTRSLPEPWQSRPAARDAIQQIMALHQQLAPYLGDHDSVLTEILLRLRGWATWCLDHLGDSFVQAIEYGQALVADRERILGQAHPDTLTSRNNLALAYQNSGRLEEAIALYEQIRTDFERILGPDDPSTLTSCNNLASAYQDAQRLTEAIALYEQIRTNFERILGPDHSSTLTSCNNLASAYQDAQRLTEAIALYERTLADREQILGPDHPDTRQSRNNLANAYQAAGRLDDAEALRNLAEPGPC
jgi:tetratricopeptide (TPR) repeat protein